MSHTTAQPLHIAFAVDEHYVQPMGVNIASILAHNPDLDMIFHVFCIELSTDHQDRLQHLAQQSGKTIHIHPLPSLPALTEPEHSGHYSQAIHLRLSIPQALAPITDRVLYLDADMLCLGEISKLAQLDLSEVTVAAVRDFNALSMRTRLSYQHCTLRDYFNAGLLLINIPRWLEQRVSERTLDKMLNPTLKLKYRDQDALNLILDAQVRVLDSIWNHQCPLTRSLRKAQLELDAPADTRFIHFIGPLKPWRSWNPHASRALFVQYQSQSPWAGLDLDDHFSERERYVYTRFMYRTLFRQRRYLQGMRWYLRFRALKAKAA